MRFSELCAAMGISLQTSPPAEVYLGRADVLDERTNSLSQYSRPFASATCQSSLLHSPFSSKSTSLLDKFNFLQLMRVPARYFSTSSSPSLNSNGISFRKPFPHSPGRVFLLDAHLVLCLVLHWLPLCSDYLFPSVLNIQETTIHF